MAFAIVVLIAVSHLLQTAAAVPLNDSGNVSAHCTWTEWGAWVGCLPTCGPSKDYRIRNASGTGCPAKFVEVKDCVGSSFCEEFRVDCEWSNWFPWGSCMGGVQHRDRYRAINARFGGKPCEGEYAETRSCSNGNLRSSQVGTSQNATPSNTSNSSSSVCRWGAWEPWSGCLPACGVSVDFRILHQTGPNQSSCKGEFMEVRNCTGSTCPEEFNCEWSNWDSWSSCLIPCGPGSQHRSRHVVINAQYGGKPCDGPHSQSEDCEGPPCNPVTSPQSTTSAKTTTSTPREVPNSTTTSTITSSPPSTTGTPSTGNTHIPISAALPQQRTHPVIVMLGLAVLSNMIARAQ